MASISYVIQGIVQDNMGNEWKSNKFVITIREPIKEAMHEMQNQQNFQVTTCCCCNQGNCEIKCILDKNAYSIGEIATITAKVNAGLMKSKIKSMKLQLCKQLYFRATNYNRSKFIENQIVEVNSESIEIGQEKDLINQLQLLNNQGTLQPSTNGMQISINLELLSNRIIQCKYFIRYIGDIDAIKCCDKAPGFDIPIQIYQLPPNYQEVVPPENWNPEILPCNNLVFDQAYAYNLPPIGLDMPEPPMPGGFNQPNMGFDYPPQINQQQQQQYYYDNQYEQQQCFGLENNLNENMLQVKNL